MRKRKKPTRKRKPQAAQRNQITKTAKTSTTPYDDAWRTLTTNVPKLLIPMVNEVFGTHFSDSAEVVLRQNEHMFSSDDGTTGKRVTDANFTIQEEPETGKIGTLLGNGFSICEGSTKKHYIYECESKPVEPAMLIRFVEYSVKSGTEMGTVDGKTKLTIHIPQIAILSLRTTAKTPSEMVLEIKVENDSCSAPVRVMKLSDYDADSILEKKLYLLIPFLLFNDEKEFKRIEEDDDEYNKLLNKVRTLYSRMDDAVDENSDGMALLDLYANKLLRAMTHTVVNGLAKNYPKIQEGVNSVVGGRVIDTEVTRIWQDGVRQGRREGKKEGAANAWNEMAERMVADGEPGDRISKYTRLGRKEIDSIAQRLNRTVSWGEARV